MRVQPTRPRCRTCAPRILLTDMRHDQACDRVRTRSGILVACFCALLLLACRITDRGNAETWAIGSIVAVHAAEDRFHSLSGRYGTLGELGSAEGNLIGRDLAEGSSHGYYFVVSVTKAGYVVHANPYPWAEGARRSFYSDETRVIWQNWSGQSASSRDEQLR